MTQKLLKQLTLVLFLSTVGNFLATEKCEEPRVIKKQSPSKLWQATKAIFWIVVLAVVVSFGKKALEVGQTLIEKNLDEIAANQKINQQAIDACMADPKFAANFEKLNKAREKALAAREESNKAFAEITVLRTDANTFTEKTKVKLVQLNVDRLLRNANSAESEVKRLEFLCAQESAVIVARFVRRDAV